MANLDQILCVASSGWIQAACFEADWIKKFWCPWQQKAPIDLQWGKWCLYLFFVAFDPILFILADNEDMHKISEEFEFLPDRTSDYGLSCLEGLKKFPIDLQWENGVSMLACSFFIESSSKAGW